MKTLYKLAVLTATLSGAALVSHAQVQTTVIYSDNFNRTGVLSGTGPVIGANAPAWAQGQTWVANSQMSTDGSKVTAAGVGSTFANGYLAADIRVDSGIYELKVTATVDSGSGGTWSAFGFATNTNNPSASFYSNSIGMTYYNRGSGNWTGGAAVATFIEGLSDMQALNGVNESGGTPLTMSITLNTYAVTNNLVITLVDSHNPSGDVVVRTLTRTLTAEQINAINAIKIGVANTATGSFEDLSFTVTTQIPEPAAFPLVVLFVSVAVCIIRKQRRK